MEGLGFIAISGFAARGQCARRPEPRRGQEARAREAVRLTVRYCLVVTMTTAIAFLLIPGRLVSAVHP